MKIVRTGSGRRLLGSITNIELCSEGPSSRSKLLLWYFSTPFLCLYTVVPYSGSESNTTEANKLERNSPDVDLMGYACSVR
jgi:hypothetical protein